jgi:hypothetical protein
MRAASRSRIAALAVAVLAAAAHATPGAAQDTPPAGAVTSPERFFGHRIGADYVLPNYGSSSSTGACSHRVRTHDAGVRSARPPKAARSTWPSSRRPTTIAPRAAPRDRAHAGARPRRGRGTGETLAEDGRAVVWIDGGLHATEVLGAQQLMETVWQLVSRNDAETRRILDDVIVLAVHANPDGHDLVADWYMRRASRSRARPSSTSRGSTRSTSATTTTATSTCRASRKPRT